MYCVLQSLCLSAHLPPVPLPFDAMHGDQNTFKCKTYSKKRIPAPESQFCGRNKKTTPTPPAKYNKNSPVVPTCCATPLYTSCGISQGIRLTDVAPITSLPKAA